MRKMHKLSKFVPMSFYFGCGALILSFLMCLGSFRVFDQVSMKDFIVSFLCFFFGFLPLPGVFALYVFLIDPNWKAKLSGLLIALGCVLLGTFIMLQAPFVKRTPDKEIAIPKMI